MTSFIWIGISVGVFLISLIVYAVRKSNLHALVSEEYKIVEKESDKFIKIMEKIIEDDKFNILLNDDEFQHIEFPIENLNLNIYDYENIDNQAHIEIIRFCRFLFEENQQLPLLIIDEDRAISPSFNKDGEISGSYLINNVNEWKQSVKNLDIHDV